MLFAITVPFMWCALIWDFLIYTFYVIDFIKYKPSASITQGFPLAKAAVSFSLMC